MKNKGFTLIEILGVIVVIGILAIIIYPKVAKTINESQENSYRISAQGLVDALNGYVMDKKATLTPFDGCTYNFDLNYSDCVDLDYNGKLPDGGIVYVDINGSVNGYVAFNDVIYVIENNNIEVTGQIPDID